MYCSLVRRWSWKYLPPGVSVWVTRCCFLVQHATKSGFVYRSVWRRFLSCDGERQKQEVMDTIWEYEMKRKDTGSMAGVTRHADNDKLLDKYPNLQEFLTAAVLEGETDRRESPTVTVWASGGVWKVSVRDRAEQLVMWLQGMTLREVLNQLETFVLDEQAPWRHDDAASERNGKRAKKGS